MEYLVIALWVVICLIGLLFALYFGLNWSVHHYLKPRDLTIAENLQITSEWIEFVVSKPRRREFERQHVFMRVQDYVHDRETNETIGLRLSDGIVVAPQIQVVDELGLIHEGHDTTRWGNLIGYTPKPILRSEAEMITVRIRSDKPFKCTKLGWRTNRLN